MEIYIKPSKKYRLEGKNKVYVKDIADVFADSKLMKRVESIKLMEISEKKPKIYIISIIDIIKAIDATLPGHTVTNVGEQDTVIEFSPSVKKENAMLTISKIAFVTLVLAAGSCTAIMSFHSDAQIPIIFRNYYYLVFNKTIENPKLIEIPYSIGLALGIMVFFNHVTGKKITNDPTPIEVEMSQYDDLVTDVKINALNSQKDDNKDGNT